MPVGRELKREAEDDDDTNYRWCALNGPLVFGKELGELEIRGKIVTIQTTAQLSSGRILERVLEI